MLLLLCFNCVISSSTTPNIKVSDSTQASFVSSLIRSLRIISCGLISGSHREYSPWRNEIFFPVAVDGFVLIFGMNILCFFYSLSANTTLGRAFRAILFPHLSSDFGRHAFPSSWPPAFAFAALNSNSSAPLAEQRESTGHKWRELNLLRPLVYEKNLHHQFFCLFYPHRRDEELKV